jgi:hypothetical protein
VVTSSIGPINSNYIPYDTVVAFARFKFLNRASAHSGKNFR